MVLARDDFEEQCNFVDVEVPDVECQEVEINNSPCPFFVADYGVFNSKNIHKLFIQVLQQECRPVTKKIETETLVEHSTHSFDFL